MNTNDDLERLNPPVGMPVKLVFSEPDLEAGSRLLGYWPGRSLLVRTPLREGKPMLFRQGRRVRLTFMQARQVVGFNTEVLQECLHPYPYLHLAWPAEVEQVVVRKAPRVGVNLICTVQVEGAPEQAGRIVDLSRNGCGLQLKPDVTVLEEDGVVLKFRVKIAGVEQIFTLEGRIRSVDDGEKYQTLGVEFLGLSQRQQALLEAYVNQELVRKSQHL